MCCLIFCNVSKKLINELVSPIQHKDYNDAHVSRLFLPNTEHGHWRKQIMIYDWWSGIE